MRRPDISYEVYRGSMATGKLLMESPDSDRCRYFILRLRDSMERNPYGWRGDITLVRLHNGKRERLKTYRRPRGDVRQTILRLMEEINGNRSNEPTETLSRPAAQRHDGVRPLRPAMGYKRQRSA